MSETITLGLDDATTDQLRAALREATTKAGRCDEQGSMHTWWTRAEAIRVELKQRRVVVS